MSKKALISLGIDKNRSFDLLLDTAMESLNKNGFSYISSETSYILSRPELVTLVKSFQPEDSIELLLILQFLIGYLWSTEKLASGGGFEPFTNLSLRAGDLLVRYKALQLKKSTKNAIPHERPNITIQS